MKKWILIIAGISLFYLVSHAQATEDLTKNTNNYAPHYWSGTKEIGLNVTPLISKLIPFNLGSDNSGLIGLTYRKYYTNRALRMNFGFNLEDTFIDPQSIFFYFSIGTEKRNDLGKKWYYTSGWDFLITADNVNDEGTFAISKGYGIEYHFTERFFLGTYAQWYIGVGSETGLKIKMIPPAAIFFNARLF